MSRVHINSPSFCSTKIEPAVIISLRSAAVLVNLNCEFSFAWSKAFWSLGEFVAGAVPVWENAGVKRKHKPMAKKPYLNIGLCPPDRRIFFTPQTGLITETRLTKYLPTTTYQDTLHPVRSPIVLLNVAHLTVPEGNFHVWVHPDVLRPHVNNALGLSQGCSHFFDCLSL